MNKLIQILFVLLAPIILQAQNLIPTPKKVILKEDHFTFDQVAKVSTENVSEDNAKLLKEVLKHQTNNHYSTELGNLKTTYMKIVAKYYGKLPEWHKAGGADYESMLFADEIIIK